MVARFVYVSQSLAVAVARIVIASTVSYVFWSRKLDEG